MDETNSNILDEGIFKITLQNAAKSKLRKAAHWAFIVAIVGIVWVLFIAFGAAYSYYNLTPLNNMDYIIGSKLLIMLFFFFPFYFLFQFSIKIKRAVATNDGVLLEKGFGDLKNVFKYFLAAVLLSILSTFSLLLEQLINL